MSRIKQILMNILTITLKVTKFDVFIKQLGPGGWGCRIHRLHLCRGVRLPPTSVLDMTLNNVMVKL